MSTQINIRSSEPIYYYREYKNDVPKKNEKCSEDSWATYSKRVALVALPYLSLYKPVSFPLSLAMGGMRVYTSFAQLIESIKMGDAKNISYAWLQTVISVISLVGTIFAHPLGMLISTAHDLVIEMAELIHHLQSGDWKKAMESCFSILNNALYLSLFLHGGLELYIASFMVQILLGLYHAQNDLRSGNWLEAAGHFGMAMVRCNQLHSQVKLLKASSEVKEQENQPKIKKLATASVEHKEPLEERIKKYESNPWKWPALHYAIEMRDEEAAFYLLKTKPQQAKMLTPDLHLTRYYIAENDHDYEYKVGTEKGISAIELAVQHNSSVELARQLIDLGADFKQLRKDYYGDILPYYDTRQTERPYNYYRVNERNKRIYSPFNFEEFQEFSPLYWAVKHKNQTMIDLLISRGVDLNQQAYGRNQRFHYYDEKGIQFRYEMEKLTGIELLTKMQQASDASL